MRDVAAIDGGGSILCLYSCAAVGISAVIYCCIALQLANLFGRSKVCVCEVLHMCTGASHESYGSEPYNLFFL